MKLNFFLKNKIIVIFLILTVFFLVFMIININKSTNTKNIPKAEKGIIDLRGIDIVENIIPLKGEWEFYWNQIILPEDYEKNTNKMTCFFEVPDVWINYKKTMEI